MITGLISISACADHQNPVVDSVQSTRHLSTQRAWIYLTLAVCCEVIRCFLSVWCPFEMSPVIELCRGWTETLCSAAWKSLNPLQILFLAELSGLSAVLWRPQVTLIHLLHLITTGITALTFVCFYCTYGFFFILNVCPSNSFFSFLNNWWKLFACDTNKNEIPSGVKGADVFLSTGTWYCSSRAPLSFIYLYKPLSLPLVGDSLVVVPCFLS